MTECILDNNPKISSDDKDVSDGMLKDLSHALNHKTMETLEALMPHLIPLISESLSNMVRAAYDKLIDSVRETPLKGLGLSFVHGHIMSALMAEMLGRMIDSSALMVEDNAIDKPAMFISSVRKIVDKLDEIHAEKKPTAHNL